MIKIPFFRKNFLQAGSLKVATNYRRSRIVSQFGRPTPTNIRMFKKGSNSNLAIMHSVGITESSFSLIHQLKLAVDTEINLTRAGSYLINSALIGKV